MHIEAGERLCLTLWDAGCRAIVSLNTFAVTQPALEKVEPAIDGFTYDVTSWLHDGCNTLTVVLIGPTAPTLFRMAVTQGSRPPWTLNEADFLPLELPWRLWTLGITATNDEPASTLPALARLQPDLPNSAQTGMSLIIMPCEDDKDTGRDWLLDHAYR